MSRLNIWSVPLVILLLVLTSAATSGAPSVKITSPANNAVLSSRTVNVTGTAAGSEAQWVQTTKSDFAAGTNGSLILSSDGEILLEEALYDDFNDNSFDTARWTNGTYPSPGINTIETGGMLNTTCIGTSDPYGTFCTLKTKVFAPTDFIASIELLSFQGSGSGYGCSLGNSPPSGSSDFTVFGPQYDYNNFGTIIKVIYCLQSIWI